jgi:hypothetical protein
VATAAVALNSQQASGCGPNRARASVRRICEVIETAQLSQRPIEKARHYRMRTLPRPRPREPSHALVGQCQAEAQQQLCGVCHAASLHLDSDSLHLDSDSLHLDSDSLHLDSSRRTSHRPHTNPLSCCSTLHRSIMPVGHQCALQAKLQAERLLCLIPLLHISSSRNGDSLAVGAPIFAP